MKNKSGAVVILDRVLILPDKVDEMAGSLHKPVETIERDQMKQVRGEVIDIGEEAYEGRLGRVPEVGDRVLIFNYAGVIFRDGDTEYRIIDDKDVIAILERG